MSDTPSDTPSDDTPEPDEPETVVDLADEKESGDKPAGDIAAWKLVAVIAAVVVVVIGGLAAYHYRGKIFKSSTTKTTQAHAPQGTAPVDRLEDKFDRPDSDNLGSVGGQAWTQVVGKWGIKNKQAYVVEPNPKGPRNFVVVDLYSGDGFVQADAARLATSWSLLFRYQSPNGYWRLWWDQEHKGFHLSYVEKDGAADARWADFVASSKVPQPVKTAPPARTPGSDTTP